MARYALTSQAKIFFQSLPFSRTLLAFDYDGTLCPLVTDRDRADLSKTVLRKLRSLSHKRKIAILTGRSRSDAKKRLPGVKAIVIGNHGAEGGPYRKLCRHWDKILRKQLSPWPHADLENKTYSLTLHSWHHHKALMKLCSQLRPKPRVVPGKQCINIVPKNAPNKGDALLRLLNRDKRLQYSIFIGDDVTDEDVFKLKDPRIISIRVGKSAHSQAQWFLKEQSEILKLFRFFVSPLPGGLRAARSKDSRQ